MSAVITGIPIFITIVATVVYICGTIVEIIMAVEDYNDTNTPERKAEASHDLRMAPLWPLRALKKLQDAWTGR